MFRYYIGVFVVLMLWERFLFWTGFEVSFDGVIFIFVFVLLGSLIFFVVEFKYRKWLKLVGIKVYVGMSVLKWGLEGE